MESSKITNWLQVLANLGIVGGLVLVGIQINQNTEIAQADLRSRVYEQTLQYQLAMLGENPSRAVAKAANNPSELTDEDLLVLRRVFAFWTNMDSQTEFNIEQGFVRSADNVRRVWQNRAGSLYGANPVWAAMWEEFRENNIDRFEWVKIVDGQFTQLEEHDSHARRLERWHDATQRDD